MIQTYDWLVYCYHNKESDFRKQVEEIMDSGKDAVITWADSHRLSFFGEKQYVLVERIHEEDIRLANAKITYHAAGGMMDMKMEGITKDEVEWV